MLTQEEAVEIRVLAKRGMPLREISRLTGLSRNTVRRYLRQPDAERYKPRTPRPTKLDAFHQYLQKRVKAAEPDWIPATVLLREIQQQGYSGGITQLKVWLNSLKPKVEKVPPVRFETPPGLQMQADFTLIRRGRSPLYALVATLGYSRATFVRFCDKQDEQALIQGLREAFDFLGGVPQQVLFDNAKTVVLEREAYGKGQHRWNSDLMEFAKECGFVPKLCRPYRAQTKGKVERFNRYLRHSFWVPLKAQLKADGLDLDAQVANQAVRRWLHEVANERVHATTGEVPNRRLQIEQKFLLPSPKLTMPVALRKADPIPIESLQHPLSDYDALLGQTLREALEVQTREVAQ